MNALVSIAVKLLKDAAVRYANGDEPDEGEWRGKYALTKMGVAESKLGNVSIYRCEIDATDPLRLFHRKSGFEFSPVKSLFHTDLGSIPWMAQGIKKLRLKPDSFPKSYILHDAIYSQAEISVRKTGQSPDWHAMPAKRADADVLLHVGLSCEGATRAETVAIYRAVQLFAGITWQAHRRRERQA